MKRPLFLFNTLSRSVEKVMQLRPEEVTVYTCGPTVYGEQHIGNYRTFIFEDVLVKVLRHLGHSVRRVMNITDVGHLVSDGDEGEDKMEVGAKREGVSAWDVARRYEQHFLTDLKALNIEVPNPLVRATETIDRQIALVQTLQDKGYAYVISDGVYFDSSTFPGYGDLARLNIAGQQAGARVNMAEGKRNPHDFALWKLSAEPGKRDMEWKSPWGVGFPGWHLECSAIAMHELGDQIDIHTGGVDHIPVHHTNEIAQSEAATGKPFVKYWAHAEFLLMDGGKMSKSLGNLYTLENLEERGFSPLDFRMLTYTASYRSKLNFTWEALQSAQTALGRLYKAVKELEENSKKDLDKLSEHGELLLKKAETAMADDLNMASVMSVVWEVIGSSLPAEEKLKVLYALDGVLSFDLQKNATFKESAREIPEYIRDLLEKRQEARAVHKWEDADAFRLEIEAAGYYVKDTSDGVKVEAQP
jgi:cysteinyl-tRNA synthetase